MTGPALAQEDASVKLEQIIAKLAKWRASFVNVRVVYESRSLPPLNQPLLDWSPPSDPASAHQFSLNEWIWADHGLSLLDDRSFYWRPGKPGSRTLDGYNGPKGLSFRALYERPPEGIEELKQVELGGGGAGKPISWKSITPMKGLYFPGTVEWLSDILAKGEWKVEGVETVLGARCAKVAGGNSALWLDLERDCLPRRHQILKGGKVQVGTDFVVDELQQLAEGLWFPKQARVQLQTDPVQNRLIVLTEAEVNISLDLTRFDPPELKPGVVVADTRIGKVYTHGGQSTPPAGVATPNHLDKVPQPPSAVPPSSWGWPIAVLCGSLALFLVGLWLRKKE